MRAWREDGLETETSNGRASPPEEGGAARLGDGDGARRPALHAAPFGGRDWRGVSAWIPSPPCAAGRGGNPTRGIRANGPTTRQGRRNGKGDGLAVPLGTLEVPCGSFRTGMWQEYGNPPRMRVRRVRPPSSAQQKLGLGKGNATLPGQPRGGRTRYNGDRFPEGARCPLVFMLASRLCESGDCPRSGGAIGGAGRRVPSSTGFES